MTSAAKPAPDDLTGRLPQGETVLWQGRPDWRSLAIRAFHVRKIGIYFGLLLIWRAALGLLDFSPMSAAGTAWLLAAGITAVVIPTLLAWIYSRTATYLITTRRVVMRFGVALPMTLNLPFRSIEAAAASVHRSGTADIPLRLGGTTRLAYLHLWPFARPWRLTRPEPMLRSVPDGERVAVLLANALQAAGGNGPAPQAAAQAPAAPAVHTHEPLQPAAA